MARCAACHGPRRPLPPIPGWMGDVGAHAHSARSIVCLARLGMRGNRMGPTDEQKRKALEAASDAAGAFLEATKAFDLRRLSRDRWLRLLRFRAETYADELREAGLDDDIPF